VTLEPEQLGDRTQAAGLEFGEQRDEDPTGGQRVALRRVARHHVDAETLGLALGANVSPLRMECGGKPGGVEGVMAEVREPTGSPRPGQDRDVEGVVTD
jgi:hypothetical protein